MPRRIVLLIIALLLSGGVFFLAQQWLHGQLKAHGVAGGGPGGPPPAVKVLVAKTDLAAGALLTADSLRWQVWPADDPAAAYITDKQGTVQDYVGAVVRARLAAGEPLVAGKVVRQGDRGFLAAVLSPGDRAVTINVSPNTGMAGFVTPGDHVDLILTLTVQPKDKEGATRHVSETVLADLRVVGVDQTLSDDKKSDKSDKKDLVSPKTATLEVTPKQAEIVAVAADLGVLSLSLRSLGRPGGDPAPAQPTHTWDSEAAKGLLADSSSDKARRSGGPTLPQRRVIIVRGDAVSVVGFTAPGPRGALTP